MQIFITEDTFVWGDLPISYDNLILCVLNWGGSSCYIYGEGMDQEYEYIDQTKLRLSMKPITLRTLFVQ